MTAVVNNPVARARPGELFARDDWAAATRVSTARGVWLVAHAWGVVLLTIGATLWLWSAFWPLGLVVTPIALAILGGRQLGLAILMHDAAHALLIKDRRWNDRIGAWLCAAPVGADLGAYRSYHLAHHRYTQTDADPDLGLSAPFPVTRASLTRKLIRDLSGQTFVKQRTAQLRGSLITPDGVFVGGATARFVVANVALLACSFALTGAGWGYALWLAALGTTFPAALRIRNIAEHACVTSDPADPFSHARTTRANWFERALVAPYWVNYHAEHHLFMGVPSHRLPRVHALLASKHPDMVIAPGYAAVLREVTALN